MFKSVMKMYYLISCGETPHSGAGRMSPPLDVVISACTGQEMSTLDQKCPMILQECRCS